MEDFCNHYLTAAVPTRVRKPKTRRWLKIRSSWFIPVSLQSCATHILRSWGDEQGNTWKGPLPQPDKNANKTLLQEEKFLSDEKPLLLPLSGEPYEIKYYRQYRVMATTISCYIQTSTIIVFHTSISHSRSGSFLPELWYDFCPGQLLQFIKEIIHQENIHHQRTSLLVPQSLSEQESGVLPAEGERKSDLLFV